MRRAVIAMLAWGFAELHLNRVHAFVMTSNARSIALLERCGFVREGRYDSIASPAARRRLPRLRDALARFRGGASFDVSVDETCAQAGHLIVVESTD